MRRLTRRERQAARQRVAHLGLQLLLPPGSCHTSLREATAGGRALGAAARGAQQMSSWACKPNLVGVGVGGHAHLLAPAAAAAPMPVSPVVFAVAAQQRGQRSRGGLAC